MLEYFELLDQLEQRNDYTDFERRGLLRILETAIAYMSKEQYDRYKKLMQGKTARPAS